jgi:hypothetical protein
VPQRRTKKLPVERSRKAPPPAPSPTASQTRAASRFFEKLGVADGARGDHPGHLAFDQTLCLGRIFDLIADRHLEAGGEQLAQVGIEGMMGDAAHGRLVLGALLAGGELDFQDRCGAAGVLEEHLVEVAHAVQKDGIRMSRLELEVLAKHRGQPPEGDGRHVRRHGWGVYPPILPRFHL